MRAHHSAPPIGDRYGRLVVIGSAEPYRIPSGKTYRQVLLRCDCGIECVKKLAQLRFGRIKSCGCLHRDLLAQRNHRHGLTDSPEYSTWANMLTRCQNPNHKDWKLYGGKGVTVCPEWQSFDRFYTDMGPKPQPGLTLDRIDSGLGYSPGNCRWATPRQQARNISTNRILTHEGQTMCSAEWAEQTGINPRTISQRLARGWPVGRVLTTPVGGFRANNRLVTYNGTTLNIATWSKRTGIDHSTLEKRLNAGWSVERALTMPVRHKRSEAGSVNSISTEGPSKP